MTGDVYVDPTLIPVTEEVSWERAPFATMARELHARLSLPDWKLAETTRNLYRIFERGIAEGKTFDDALAVVQAEFERICK